jgi:flagellar hook assembly protein FlgD
MSNEYKLFIGKASGLSVSFIEFNPNPFSPGIGGLRISYVPESDDKTMVKTTIKAFTMTGKHISTIVAGQMRTVGSVATDMWDGKTEMGYFAKNGRYIIQIEVEDSTGKKQFLNTVVMVK